MGSGYDIHNDAPTATSHHFKGTFEGNGYTLSNITTGGFKYVGIFGYNTGTIRGLNIINLNLIGNHRTGGVVGWNKGTVTDINLTGNVLGYTSDVGGIIGVNDHNSVSTNLLVNVNVEGGYLSVVGG